jgi:hypothetical protein
LGEVLTLLARYAPITLPNFGVVCHVSFVISQGLHDYSIEFDSGYNPAGLGDHSRVVWYNSVR